MNIYPQNNVLIFRTILPEINIYPPNNVLIFHMIFPEINIYPQNNVLIFRMDDVDRRDNDKQMLLLY